MKYNCQNCFYSNFLKDGRVMCDKKLLSEGKEIYIEADKTELPCPAHSHKFIEEIRYMRDNKWLHDSEEDEYCDICRRKIDLDKTEQYECIPIINDKGKISGYTMRCKICKEKGRI